MNSKRRKFKDVHPIVLFAVGLLAFGWQVIFEDTDRPMLLSLIAGMLGFPFARIIDKTRESKGGEE